jgi:hypothetical protein
MPSNVSHKKTRMLSMLPRPRGYLQLREVRVEARSQCTAFGFGRTRSSEHDEIPRRRLGLVAECFSRETFETITVHGALRYSARDRQAEASHCGISREHGEVAIAGTRGSGEDSPEFRRTVQSLVGGESCCAGKQCGAKTKPATA